jgi:hypothetical protein
VKLRGEQVVALEAAGSNPVIHPKPLNILRKFLNGRPTVLSGGEAPGGHSAENSVVPAGARFRPARDGEGTSHPRLNKRRSYEQLPESVPNPPKESPRRSRRLSVVIGSAPLLFCSAPGGDLVI